MKTIKTTKMNKILEYLEVSQEQYEHIYFGAYINWCEKFGETAGQFQNILANASVGFIAGTMSERYISVVSRATSLAL